MLGVRPTRDEASGRSLAREFLDHRAALLLGMLELAAETLGRLAAVLRLEAICTCAGAARLASDRSQRQSCDRVTRSRRPATLRPAEISRPRVGTKVAITRPRSREDEEERRCTGPVITSTPRTCRGAFSAASRRRTAP